MLTSGALENLGGAKGDDAGALLSIFVYEFVNNTPNPNVIVMATRYTLFLICILMG
jgi:hypothetical protein